jgi:hypothetical protein
MEYGLRARALKPQGLLHGLPLPATTYLHGDGALKSRLPARSPPYGEQVCAFHWYSAAGWWSSQNESFHLHYILVWNGPDRALESWEYETPAQKLPHLQHNQSKIESVRMGRRKVPSSPQYGGTGGAIILVVFDFKSFRSLCSHLELLRMHRRRR